MTSARALRRSAISSRFADHFFMICWAFSLATLIISAVIRRSSCASCRAAAISARDCSSSRRASCSSARVFSSSRAVSCVLASAPFTVGASRYRWYISAVTYWVISSRFIA